MENLLINFDIFSVPNIFSSFSIIFLLFSFWTQRRILSHKIKKVKYQNLNFSQKNKFNLLFINWIYFFIFYLTSSTLIVKTWFNSSSVISPVCLNSKSRTYFSDTSVHTYVVERSVIELPYLYDNVAE